MPSMSPMSEAKWWVGSSGHGLIRRCPTLPGVAVGFPFPGVFSLDPAGFWLPLEPGQLLKRQGWKPLDGFLLSVTGTGTAG